MCLDRGIAFIVLFALFNTEINWTGWKEYDAVLAYKITVAKGIQAFLRQGNQTAFITFPVKYECYALFCLGKRKKCLA